LNAIILLKEPDFESEQNFTGKVIGQYDSLESSFSIRVGKGLLKNFFFVVTASQLKVFQIQNNPGTGRNFFFFSR
jgi:hypothetical protein